MFNDDGVGRAWFICVNFGIVAPTSSAPLLLPSLAHTRFISCLSWNIALRTSALIQQAPRQDNLFGKAAWTSTLVPHAQRVSSTLISPRTIVENLHGSIQVL